MFVRAGGRGPAVLLLHGAPSTPEELRDTARTLEERFRVIVPDLPGYGFSPCKATRSLAAERAELIAALRDLGIERLHAAIGYSLGGYRALDLALAFQVDRLGLFASFGDLPAAHREQLRALASSLRGDAFDADMRELLLTSVLTPSWRQRHPERLAEVTRALEITTPRAFAAELLAMAEAPSLLGAATRFRGRVMIRAGEHDGMMPVAYSRALGEALGAPVTVVPEVGHALLLEDSAASLTAILELVA